MFKSAVAVVLSVTVGVALAGCGNYAVGGYAQASAVDSAIVGVRTMEQLEGLDRAAELELAPETMARLDEIFDINRGRKIMKGESPEAHSW